jgi:CHAT domain-containing protein/Tfp pilus assembly protein PilF
MNRKNRFVIIIVAGVSLLAVAGAQAPSLKDSIAQYEQEVTKARSDHKTRELLINLNILASFYRQSGQLRKALDCLNEALPIEQKVNSVLGQAMTFNTMGRVYTDLGEEDKALSYLKQALPLWQTIGQRTGEADALTYIGRVYNNLGQREEALKNLNDAMEIWHDIDNPDTSISAQAAPSSRPSGRIARRIEAAKQKFASATFISSASAVGEAGTLDNLGRTYSDEGQGFEAIKCFDQSLPLFRQGGERAGEALVLNDMGPAYAEVGQKQKALESLNQALSIWREIGSRQGEALTLNNIGRLYRDLGQQQSAMDYYNQALPIWREVGNRSGEGLALSDIGRAYADLGQPRKALEYAAQALPIFRETGSRRGEAMTLNNMGRDHSDLGEAQEAMKLELQALAIWREVKDQRNEAQDLMTIAWSYSAFQQSESSLASALAALYLAKSVGDPEVEGAIETSLMMGFRKQHRLEEAIFFGSEAVNSYQLIRKNITGLDKSLQAGFAQSKSGAYRILAELLVEAGRLGDAERILDLLKEQEFKDLVPGSAPGTGASIEPLKPSPVQQKIESLLPDLEKKARDIEEWNLQSAQLQANPARTHADDEQLKSLDANLQQAKSAIRDSFDNTIIPELDKQSAAGQPIADSTQSYLQSALAKLGHNVIGIRILLGEDHAYAIVVTANSRQKFELPASSADLRGKAFEALKAIGSHFTDPRPQLNRLYTMILAPLEDELKAIEAASGAQDNVPTLLWSLDDALRYVPMGALYDGNHYMVERFHNVLFTPESYGHITDAPIQSGDPPKVLALGLSKSYDGLPALPGVIPELDSVAHDPSIPDSHGPMQGKILSDEQFTLAALKTELGSGSVFPVVHIASHFVLIAGMGDEPFLLMGGNNVGDANGFEWNLSEMENSPVAFHGTRLLTLSACSTAKDYKSRNGFEMDSLGMVAQQKEAEAVLATLWDVNDLSTSHIMSNFYDRWVKNPAKGKAEALRQAQLAFLHSASSATGANTGRGFESIDQSSTRTSSLGYAHPYYWAPFVIIGNYQ